MYQYVSGSMHINTYYCLNIYTYVYNVAIYIHNACIYIIVYEIKWIVIDNINCNHLSYIVTDTDSCLTTYTVPFIMNV